MKLLHLFFKFSQILGSLLKRQSTNLPSSSSAWHSLASNVNRLGWTRLFIQYAYRPLKALNTLDLSNSDLNNPVLDSIQIDPRTYYWLRHWLYERQQTQDASNPFDNDVALIPTWIMSGTESRKFFEEYHKMPLNTNNVCFI